MCKKIVDKIIYILFYLLIISIVFNIIDYMGLPDVYEGNIVAFSLFFIVAILTATVITPRLYKLFQNLENKV